MTAANSNAKSERAIVWVLRYGSLLATAVIALGLGLAFWRGPESFVTYHRVPVTVLLSRVLRFEPAALSELGILLLLATPIFRILAAVVTFALDREYKYVLVSLGVLTVVLVSIGFAIA